MDNNLNFGLTISSKSNSFQLYEFNYKDFEKLHSFFDAKENGAELSKDQPGFGNSFYSDNGVAAEYTEIIGQEIDILDEGRVQTLKVYTVERCGLAALGNILITFGKAPAVKSALMAIMKFTKIEPKPVFISAEKLFKISDHMSFIRTMDFDKMEHPTIKKLHFDGKIEALADIAPFHNYTSNIRSVKGVLSTPYGIRTIKLSCAGMLQISKKKEEELDAELFNWIYQNIIKAV